jgi:hypothetical protein
MKGKPLKYNSPTQVRLEQKQREEIEAIARAEHRNFTDTMRLLLLLGMERYKATGKLWGKV